MDKQTISNFYFDYYNIEKIKFNINKQFKNEEVELDIKSEVDVSINSKENKGFTKINMIIWDEPNIYNQPFMIELSIVGYFHADEDMENEEFEYMCKYNGAAILFPFLRSAITDITKVANVTPLVLPLINIKKFIDGQQRNNKETQESESK